MFPAERTVDLWHGVVAGFDGTDRARCAVRWAAAEAAVRGCPLHVVRVVEPVPPTVATGWVPPGLSGPSEDQRCLIEDEVVAEIDACRAATPGLEAHGAIHDGRPHSRLAEHANLVGANVVAVGVSDLGAVSRLLLGSTGAELIRTTRRVVVAVRDLTPVQQAAVVTGYAPVVAMVDDRATSARVLAFACDMAHRWGTSVTVVHAGRVVPAAVRGWLTDARSRYPGVRVDVAAAGTQPHLAALDLSADAPLVAVGDRRHGVLRRLLTGSAAHTLLHHAKCSVAVVP
ncbi:universal stress protein [Actinophytocola glycyrrhizae]|uniref:Universal stress protein n=1 Tax=Actinophytocola glycyrrhizae TaxID=2044873 RepID=A0ABV9RZL1_9PSEU